MLFRYAPSTIQRYSAGLLTIQRAAASVDDDEPFLLFFETFLLNQLNNGCVGSTIRNYLSALGLLNTLGLWRFALPESLWKLSGTAERFRQAPPCRTWATPALFAKLAGACATPQEFCVLAKAVLAFSLALRVCEAAALGHSDAHVRLINNQPATFVHLHWAKQQPGKPQSTEREVPFFVATWIGALIRCEDQSWHAV